MAMMRTKKIMKLVKHTISDDCSISPISSDLTVSPVRNFSSPLDEVSTPVNKFDHFTPLPVELLKKRSKVKRRLIFEDSTNPLALEKKSKRECRKHCCFFCQKLLTNIKRHLTTTHKNEPWIKMALGEKVPQEEELKTFSDIRKLGDEKYNQKHDDIIVTRKSKKVTIDQYIICMYCNGRYSSLNFRKHRKKCRENKQRMRDSEALSKIKALKISADACDLLKYTLFPTFKKEMHSKIIFNDPVCIIWGNFLCRKYANRISDGSYVYQTAQLRLLADILNIAKQLDPSIKELHDMFDPSKFQLSLDVIYKRANHEAGVFQSPYTATAAYTLLKQVNNELKCISIGNENRELQKRYENYGFLLEKQNCAISKKSVENMTARQRKRIEHLPSTQQVGELLTILDEETKGAFLNLENDVSVDNYVSLSKITLAYIMAFNRKRPGDVQNTLIEEFNNIVKLDDETLKKLPESLVKHTKDLYRYTTRGKLNKTSSNLITCSMETAVRLLLKYRCAVGISDQNKYLFANPQATKHSHFQADKCLKWIVQKRKLDDTLYTANKLRKHLATATSNLDGDSQKLVSDFMGHSFNIHSNIYQIRQAQDDITKVGTILLAANGQVENDSTSLSNTYEESRKNVSDLLDDDPGNELESEKVILKECSGVLPGIERRFENQTGEIAPSDKLSHFKGRFNLDLSKRREIQNVRAKSAWTTPQRHHARRAFASFIDKETNPTFKDIFDALRDDESLQRIGKTAIELKAWVVAEIQRNRKKKGGLMVIKRWSTPKKHAVKKHFEKYVEMTLKHGRPVYPPSIEMEAILQQEDLLKDMSVIQLRAQLQNLFHVALRNQSVTGKKANKRRRPVSPISDTDTEEEWQSSGSSD